MGLSDDLKKEVAAIFRGVWSVRAGQGVPDTPDLKLTNDGVTLDATVLYADIDGSTNMVDSQTPEFAAEVYKTYLICAARLIRSEGGTITADRMRRFSMPTSTDRRTWWIRRPRSSRPRCTRHT